MSHLRAIRDALILYGILAVFPLTFIAGLYAPAFYEWIDLYLNP